MIKDLWNKIWASLHALLVNILTWLESTALNLLKKLALNAIDSALTVADMMLSVELWVLDKILDLVNLPEFSTSAVALIRDWWGRFDVILPLNELVTALNILLAWRLGFFAIGYVYKFFFKITLKLFAVFSMLRRFVS